MAFQFLSKKLSVAFLLILLLFCDSVVLGDCRKLKVAAQEGTVKGEENGRNVDKFSETRMKLEEMSLPPLLQFPFPPAYVIPQLPPLPPLPSIPAIPTFSPFHPINFPPFAFFSPPPL